MCECDAIQKQWTRYTHTARIKTALNTDDLLCEKRRSRLDAWLRKKMAVVAQQQRDNFLRIEKGKCIPFEQEISYYQDAYKKEPLIFVFVFEQKCIGW